MAMMTTTQRCSRRP